MRESTKNKNTNNSLMKQMLIHRKKSQGLKDNKNQAKSTKERFRTKFLFKINCLANSQVYSLRKMLERTRLMQ
jgi:hypothetical protein